MRAVQEGVEATALAEKEPRPGVLVVDPAMMGDFAAFCSGLRRAQSGTPYVIAVGARRRSGETVAGADEYVVRPVAVEDLVARVEWAQRVLASPPRGSHRLRAALEDGVRAKGGEVVVVGRDGTVGRVLFDHGNVVWAHLSNRPVTMRSLFEETAHLEPDDVKEVLAEAKRTGTNFVEVLVQWGLVTPEQAIDALRRSISETLKTMASLEGAEIVFAPGSRSGWRGPRFTMDDVMPHEAEEQTPALAERAPAEPHDGARCRFMPRCHNCEDAAMLSTALRESGADGIAVVYRASGRVLAQTGKPIDEDVVRGTLQVLGALSDGASVDDVLISGGDSHYLMRSAACPGAIVAMLASKSSVSVGTARHVLIQVATSIRSNEVARFRRPAR